MLPNNWIETQIGDQVTLQRGIDITRAEQRTGNIPVISSGGFSSYHDTAAVSGPGVVLGRKGVVGSVYYVEGDYWPHDTTLWVKDFHGNLPRFVYYFFKYLTPVITLMDVGSANPTLNRNHVHPISTMWPPLPEQRTIAGILGTLDDKIELNRRMNRTLESMARAVFRQWFVENQDVEDWEVGKVEDICISIENGGTPRRMEPEYWNDGTVSWFKTGELNDTALIDSEEKITETGLSNSACRLWNPKTILIALYASPTVGRLGILEIPATANQACSALVAKPEYGYLFLFYSLLFSRDELQRVAVGAAQQNINQSVVKNHKIIIPPTKLVKKFHDTIEPLYSMQLANLKESRTLARLRDSLLLKLMRGEVRVKS